MGGIEQTTRSSFQEDFFNNRSKVKSNYKSEKYLQVSCNPICPLMQDNVSCSSTNSENMVAQIFHAEICTNVPVQRKDQDAACRLKLFLLDLVSYMASK